MIYTATIATPLGPMTAAADKDALTGLWFIGQKYYPACTADWHTEPEQPLFRELQAQLNGYFAGRDTSFSLPLAPRGSAFQQAVWDILLSIPYGQTGTYGEIAQQIARARSLPSMSAQAVGGAVGHNPISILVPCHRVVGSDKSLTGYAGGLDKKAALLRLEGIRE
jgi:methylated-DNA-[protein]-cysteine S-methyltransferase